MSSPGRYGSFYLRETERPVLMLAGGTGLAPFLSMLGTAGGDAAASSRSTWSTASPTTPTWSSVETLQELREPASRTSPSPPASPTRAAPSAQGLRHRITCRAEHLNDGDVDVYLCGPPPMVEAVRELASASRASTPANFHYEKFSPSGAARCVMSGGGMSRPGPFRRQGRGRHRRGPGHRPRPWRCAWRAKAARVLLVDRAELVDEVAAEIARRRRQALAITADLETYAGAAGAWRRGAGALRPHRHPGQQCRRHDLGQALRRNTTRQQIEAEIRRSLFPTLWCCRAVLPAHAGAGRRRDRQRLVGRDARRQPRALCGGQGRRQRLTASSPSSMREHGIRVGAHRARRHRGAAAPHPAQRRRRRAEQEKAWYQGSRRPDRSRPA